MEDEKKESKAVGGFARANSLTPKQRTEIAKRAAEARWSQYEAVPTTIREGVLELAGQEIPCAVLADGRRILNQAGFLRAIGRARSPKAGTGVLSTVDELPFFLQAGVLKPFLTDDLRQSTKALFYKTRSGSDAVGYNAELLPRVCDVYLKFRDRSLQNSGRLPSRYDRMVVACDILMRSLAHVGIVALIDEATGYQEVRPQDALRAYLEKIIRKELAAWVKRFPDEFYENIYKLKGWAWPGMQKNRYSVVAHYTRDLVYQRVGPSVLEELEKKEPRNEKGRRTNKLHQWLTDDVGNPMLAQHLYSLIMFQRLALKNGFGWHRFVKMVDQVMPRKGSNLELFPDQVLPTTEPQS
jgi:hypothetical protein